MNAEDTLARLLDPIDSSAPAGRNLRQTSIYRAIVEARRGDDASLPMGAWEREIKGADWQKVEHLCVLVVQNQSKDLQIASWLCEARLNIYGFSTLASSVTLIDKLLTCFWDGLYPPIDDDGEPGHRANIVRWLDGKVPTILRAALLFVDDTGDQLTWSMVQQAARFEQLRRHDDGAAERARADRTPTAETIRKSFDRVSSDRLIDLLKELECGSALKRNPTGTKRKRLNNDEYPSRGWGPDRRRSRPRATS